MTSTLLRVKRRLEDNPQDALVLVCKRTKTNDEKSSPSLFVFRGSVNDQETTHVRNILPSMVKLKGASNVNDIIDKIRQKRKEASSENRYEVVNCSRGIKEESSEADHFDLVDLIRKYDEDISEKYIYDLYTSPKEDFDISMIDDLVCIENYETDLVFGSYRDNGLPLSEDEDDSEDSNAENDYRNDYPDSENSSINEEDMIKAMENVGLEDDLSSDTGEDKIYDEPPDIFNEDVKRYGAAYAKYKEKVLKEEPDLADSTNYVFCKEIDSDDYKDDSDDGFYYGQDEDSRQYREQYRQDSSESDFD